MKVAFTILFIFIASFVFTIEAREMTLREKTVILNLGKTINVKNFMESSIPLQDLPLSEYLSYKVLKNSCSPLMGQIERIQSKGKGYKDQSDSLALLYGVCSNGVIGLSEIFISHK